MEDKISDFIIGIINKSNQPLETNEILDTVKKKFKDTTHSIVLYRLMNLRGDNKIKGKRISAGAKGVWVWWKVGVFEDQ